MTHDVLETLCWSTRNTMRRSCGSCRRTYGDSAARRHIVARLAARCSALFNLEEAVRGQTGEATIHAALRIEDAILTVYRDGLEVSRLPANVRGVIEGQRRRVEEARASLRSSRRAA